MRVRPSIVGTALTLATVGGLSLPAFAHECFNPNKPAGAGVNYTIVGFDQNGPIFQQTGPGKGIGGFATLDGVDIHTIGNSSSHEVVGRPGSQTPRHQCDGKGIDYADACGLVGP